MTDRELLEFAAKAVGILLEWDGHPDNWQPMYYKGKTYHSFDPLNDDALALRLSATLRLQVKPGKHKGDGCTAESKEAGIAGCTVFRDDPYEQMRRAIVMVAAEIGKAMP